MKLQIEWGLYISAVKKSNLETFNECELLTKIPRI